MAESTDLPWWTGLLDALLPGACAGCGAMAAGRVWCLRCEACLPRIAADACPHCQLHARTATGACAIRPRGDPLSAAVAACWLEPLVSRWIHAFKYPERGLRGLAPAAPAAIAELAARAARLAPGGPPDLVVPVALHPRRLRTRGFHPARLLARSVARAAGAPLSAAALVRVRDTPSQTGLDAAARQRNLRGAMRARRAVPACMWVVDDVITTGATVREAARALRAAGARRVVAVCAARTPL